MKVLIDTNVFLYLYTSNQEEVKIFDDLKKIESHLIFPEQIIDEFYRNRDTQLSAITANIKGQNFRVTASSSFVREFPEFEKLKTNSEECERIRKEIIKKLEEIKNNPTIDPILQKFKELTDNKNITRIKVTEKAIKRANNRYLRGNPPKSNKSDAIADEIIWELVLLNITDDLMIVSGDQTYADHITFLKREFSATTGKDLLITNKLGDAIKIIGQTPSKATEEFDVENLKREEQTREIIKRSSMGPVASLIDQTSFLSALGNFSSLQDSLTLNYLSHLDELLQHQQSLIPDLPSQMEDLLKQQQSLIPNYPSQLDELLQHQQSLIPDLPSQMEDLLKQQQSLIPKYPSHLDEFLQHQQSLIPNLSSLDYLEKFQKTFSANSAIDRFFEQSLNISESIEVSTSNQCPNCNILLNNDGKCQNCGYSEKPKYDGDQEEE